MFIQQLQLCYPYVYQSYYYGVTDISEQTYLPEHVKLNRLLFSKLLFSMFWKFSYQMPVLLFYFNNTDGQLIDMIMGGPPI